MRLIRHLIEPIFSTWKEVVRPFIFSWRNKIIYLSNYPFSQMRKGVTDAVCKRIGCHAWLFIKAISLVGRDVYEILIREYTEKQWGRPCVELPESIIRRIPVRFTFDNNYYNDLYQGIPIGGYTAIFEKLFASCDVRLNTSFKTWMAENPEFDFKTREAGLPKIIYTGAIDEFFDYCYGALDYRSLRFEHERMDDCSDFQGVAVVNYTDLSVPYTRSIEHKHFEFGTQPFTIVSKEYSSEWKKGGDPYYPINDESNQLRYRKYQSLAQAYPKIHFGGRLGSYRYTDMQDTIDDALSALKVIISK